MATRYDALHRKNWKHETYDKQMRVKIISAKLRFMLEGNGRTLSIVEETLISSAALLILTTYQYEMDFILQDGSEPNPKYLSSTNCLRATLDKLKAFAPAEQKPGETGGLDLAAIINE
jgi:hypothetical protein